MGAAAKFISRVRAAGLPPEVAESLEREIMPAFERFVAQVPDEPPTAPDDDASLLSGLLRITRLTWPHVADHFDKVVDAMSASLDDLFDEKLLEDIPRRRSLRHLEEAVSSLVRVGSMVAAVISRRPDLRREFLRPVPASLSADLPNEVRVYYRGLLAVLVGVDRMRGELGRLAPWAWLARKEMLKAEGLVAVELRGLFPPPAEHPRRVPGAWKGQVRIADDFDASLPRELEDSFYDS